MPTTRRHDLIVDREVREIHRTVRDEQPTLIGHMRGIAVSAHGVLKGATGADTVWREVGADRTVRPIPCTAIAAVRQFEQARSR